MRRIDRSNGVEATHVTDGQVSADTSVIVDEALISKEILCNIAEIAK